MKMRPSSEAAPPACPTASFVQQMEVQNVRTNNLKQLMPRFSPTAGRRQNSRRGRGIPMGIHLSVHPKKRGRRRNAENRNASGSASRNETSCGPALRFTDRCPSAPHGIDGHPSPRGAHDDAETMARVQHPTAPQESLRNQEVADGSKVCVEGEHLVTLFNQGPANRPCAPEDLQNKWGVTPCLGSPPPPPHIRGQ